ncbi:MAG: cobaltochelatase subunit CobN, partial [Acidimicrobiales bacterium]
MSVPRSGPALLLLTNAETELLALRSVLHRLPPGFPPVRGANPARLVPGATVASVPDLAGVAAVVVRLLGGRRAWEEPFDELRRRCAAAGVALVAVGGEAQPDAELAEASSVPAGIAAEVHRYLAAGGPDNLAGCMRFVADTVLMGGFGFDPPAELPMTGVFDAATTAEGIPAAGHPALSPAGRRPLVAIVFYRAHLVAGNTTFVEDLAAALHAAGADTLAVYCYSLRPDSDGSVPALDICRRRGADVVVTTVLASGSAAAPTSPGPAPDGWEVPHLAALGVPVLQAPSANRSRQEWQDDDAGLAPLDVAMGVALPEFDGRIVGPAFAFREEVDDGAGLGSAVNATRADPERSARVAGLALRLARLRHTPAGARRVVILLSAYPTRRSRLGNAVGLDTPASAIELLGCLRAAGVAVERIPASGDELMAELSDHLTYESAGLSPAQAAAAVGRLGAPAYLDWYRTLPAEAREQVESVWGPPPGQVYLGGDDLCFAGIDLGGALVAIQPPRGFGPDPIGTYHAPDLPPPHHYLAFYRWLDQVWGADAVVHLGKHGTLEWLPGKANALGPSCFPDAALGDVPLVYPFIVNDPGEGAQAKRRAHAVVVDHLLPPMTRAETYDELARLEQLLDAYAEVQAMDPAKLPELRRQVWALLVEAEIHRDLGMEGQPKDDEFDDVVRHVDGYLCALKDAQIRGGLHVLGRPPDGDALVDMVLAITRLPQAGVPSLRATVAAGLGVDLGAGRRAEVDAVEARCRQLVEALAERGWDPGTAAAGPPGTAGAGPPGTAGAGPPGTAGAGSDPTLAWVAATLVPALRRTPDELANIAAALEGRYVPAGPSGAPTRGAAHALPTGRNFYSVDPKSLPTPLAWAVGVKLADALVERHRADTGAPPRTVGLVLWGTAAMRTGGDDAAEALALLGARPLWQSESRRVVGLEPIPLDELGRGRVDVTLRISGFFRDAFPHLVGLLDDAVEMVAGLDEAPEDNPVRAAGTGDARIWGPPPGGYGSGILPLIEARAWRSDADLAEVYLAWSGFA